jgi:protein-L-isoaspartate(D-aspartate) O-methyltransferase
MPRQNPKALRQSYAEELRIAGSVRRNPRVIEAFATVRREKFLPPGPWTLHGMVSWRTPDASPAWVYHNVLLSLDKRKGLNNGSPSLWAYLLDQLDIKAGERVLQVGAGTGYYTAILAELVGKSGHVRAIEYDKRLAAIAAKNLKLLPQVELIHGDASVCDPGHDLDLIVAFAGGTHPPSLWLERLAPGGRLLMPLVGPDRYGFMLKAVRRGRRRFDAKAVSRVGFCLAKGFRAKGEARKLKKAIDRLKGKLPKLRALHLGPVSKARRNDAFYATSTFWLSRGRQARKRSN